MADANATKKYSALKGHKGIVTNVDEFHRQVLFDTWYLWACFKDIDNGRRVILSAKYPKGESIGSYYSKLIVELLLV
jgi:hypothetical protein